jgi:hypothetical protein
MNKNSTGNHNPVFNEYFEDDKIKSEFKKEFISLWPGWLDKENYHKLEEVTDSEWERFNFLIRNISSRYKLLLVNVDGKIISNIDNIEKMLVSHRESMNKTSSEFLQFIIPDLDCILTEEWDYTLIIWYKNEGVIEKLRPFIQESKLFHFSK